MAESPRVCRICEKRKPRRYCPGVSGDICAICCGTEREVTVSCPLDCPYLQDARNFERKPEPEPRNVPNADIQVSENFLFQNQFLLAMIASSLGLSSMVTEGAVDSDVKQALESLVRTYRTLQSGLLYDARPENLIAAQLYEGVQTMVDNVRQRMQEHGQPLLDSDVLRVLVFLQRLEIHNNNGRPKGRAFIHMLLEFIPPAGEMPEQDSGPGLIVTP